MAQAVFSCEGLEQRKLLTASAAASMPEVHLPLSNLEISYARHNTPALGNKLSEELAANNTGGSSNSSGGSSTQPSPPETNSSATSSFRVFDSLLYAGQPQLGAEKILVTGDLWQKTRTGNIMDVPYEPAVRAAARRAADLGQILVFDVEHWETDTRRATAEEFDANVSKLIQMVDWARNEAPSIQLGFYGILPTHDLNVGHLYYQGIRDGKPQSYQWLVDNLTANSEKLRPLADKVDYIFPSMYMEFTSVQTWLDNAAVVAEMSKIYGKPVIPFFRADYAPRVDKTESSLPIEIVRTQLEFIEQHFDGVVLWGGVELYQGRWRQEAWNVHGAPWWPTAVDILGEHLSVGLTN